MIYSLIQWFAAHPVPGMSANDFSDLLVVIALGAFTGLTRVIYQQWELKENGGIKRWLVGLMLGIVGALMGSEVSYILFEDSKYTWILALVVAWSGAEIMNLITKMFGEKIVSAGATHDETMKEDIDREKKQRQALDEKEHELTMKELDKALNEPS